MTRVSVLVAVYNAADYLRPCLDSLLGQTLRDIQIVCIDDCSTDHSLQLLNEYAARDDRVEVIHLDENSGQAHARNVGLQRAKGEYVCMVDSDDWLSADALQQAVETFEGNALLDSVLFRLVYYRQETRREEEMKMQPFKSITGREAFRLTLDWQIHGLYMTRTALHRQFPYDESRRLYSDDNTTRIHFYWSRYVGLCGGIYYYRLHGASSTRAVSAKRFEQLGANESMKRQLLELYINKQLLDDYENFRWLTLIDTYMFYYQHGHELTPEECRYGLGEIRRVWKNIEVGRLRHSLRCKFGYMPLRHSWTLFRIQEEVYFALRSLRDRLLRK